MSQDPQMPTGYTLSRDYRRLFQFIQVAGKAAGFVRTGDYHDGDVVGITRPEPWVIHIGVRGYSFASIFPFQKDDGRTEEEEFVRACEFAKLEWIEPGCAMPAPKTEESPAEEALRSLACWLGVGGYNAEAVDAEAFERRIREGVDMLVAAELRRHGIVSAPASSGEAAAGDMRGHLETDQPS